MNSKQNKKYQVQITNYIRPFTGMKVPLLGAYCMNIDKKLSISPVFSELLLHYFIYCESFSF